MQIDAFTISMASLLAILFFAFSYRQLTVGRVQSARVQQDGGSPLFAGTYLMDFAYWIFNPIVTLFVKSKVHPNTLTIVSLVISLASAYLFANGALIAAGWVWLFGSCFDAFDGQVARRTGNITKFGSVLDSTVDRVAELAVFTGLAIHFKESTVSLLIILLALSGSLLTSYITAKADIHRIQVPRGWMRRAERAVYIGVAAIFSSFTIFAIQPMLIVMWLIAICTLASSLVRLQSLAKQLS